MYILKKAAAGKHVLYLNQHYGSRKDISTGENLPLLSEAL